MEIASIIAVVSAIGNVVLGFLGLWQRAKKRTAEEQFETVREGLIIVEEAIEQQKKTAGNPGEAIASTITAFGLGARRQVDDARRIAHK